MLLVNQVLHNRYRIIRQLGHGGMGAVYEAHDNVFDTTCAVKEIIIDLSKSSNPKQQELVMIAFEREAKLLAKIKHEVVPHVRDYFTESDRQYLVMELVEGKDLGELLEERQSPFPIDDVINWTHQLLDGLDYLHTQTPPIFHRDLKPQNLKLTPRGRVKLLDFGIAKGGKEVPNQQTINNQTFVAATLNYSPIEQIFRVLDPVFREVLTQRFEARVNAVMQQNADGRSDLYALGATVYHLLTGTLPIDSLKRTVEVWSGKPDPLVHPSSLNTRIPIEFSNILLRAMDLDQGRRFASALEMQQALQKVAADGRTSGSGNLSAPARPVAPVQPTQPGQVTTDPNAATQTIPPELLPPNYRPAVSEDTIPAAVVPGETIAAAPVASPNAPPPSPFSAAGQPTEMSGFAPQSVAPPIPPPNYGEVRIESDPVVTPSQAAYLSPQQEKKSSKLWWILPILAFLGVIVVAGAGGVYLLLRNNFAGTDPANVNSTPVASPTPSKTTTPTSVASPSATPSASATPSPTATPATSPTQSSTPRPAVDPTRPPATPAPKTPAKTTPKPQPKKGSDCIFSGDC